MNVRLLLLCAPLLLGACAARTIPGTQIADNRDTRSIIQVMERYRTALEARDAEAILRLVSPSFRDNVGTHTPEDDLTYENLPEALPALFAKLESPRVDLDIRQVEVRRDGTATVIYHWNASWRMPTLGGKPQRESELEQMVLQREDGQWRIVSGL
jgi:uncharacterized protein (TIGR02246 family)